jgi:hypothetical protein
VTVLSSLLLRADFGGETFVVVVVRESGSAQRFQAEGVFSALLCWNSCWPVVVAAGQDSPCNACKLVGHGHHDDVLGCAGVKCIEPGSDGRPVALDPHTAARAPWIRILRRYTLPRLLMPNSFALPPVEY